MKHVFVLWHSHDLEDGETEDKLIGVYSAAIFASVVDAVLIIEASKNL